MRPALLCLCLSAVALAADPAPSTTAVKKKKSDVKVPSFTLPNMGEVPKADGLRKPKADEAAQTGSSTARPAEATYTVTKVQFAKQFVHGPGGQQPVQSFTSVALRGSPLTMEKFSSLVKVKCPQKANAPIELAVLDPRGDTSMSASGELVFKGATTDEVEYLVDWDPTPARAGGKFQLIVRVAGQPMGSWPLVVEEKP
ncbi:MAG TPA: hypothetical protein VFA20_35395 [Myxococcaceae bacterium]|nr:hypothetical protein [Myxococcaceae bacterium]